MEVKLCPGTVEDDGGAVVSSGGVLGGGKCSEPLARTLTWLADLGDPFAPASLSDAAVPKFVVVGATFTFALTTIATTIVVVAAAAFVGTSSDRCFAGSGFCGGGGGGFGFLGLRKERGHWLVGPS